MSEVAYRRALRWYPADWRARNEEVVVGSLLDNADHEGRVSPTPSELRELAIAGLAERMLGSDKRAMPMAIGLALAIVLSFWYPAVISWAPTASFAGSLGPFANPLVLVSAPILLAGVAFVARRARLARLLVIIGIGATVTIGIASAILGWVGPGLSAVTLYAGILAVSLSRGSAWRVTRLFAALGCALVTTVAIQIAVAQFGAIGAVSFWLAAAAIVVGPVLGLALLLVPARAIGAPAQAAINS